MKSMQALIIEQIEKRVTDAGLTLTQAAEWTNTGRLYAIDESLHTEVEIGYSFQADYCSIGLKGPGINELDIDDNPPLWRMDRKPGGNDPSDHIVTFHALDYANAQRLNEMLSLIEQACKVNA